MKACSRALARTVDRALALLQTKTDHIPNLATTYSSTDFAPSNSNTE